MRILLLFATAFLFLKANAGQTITGEKILQVTITESGYITVGRDTVNSDKLARYIQERLFKSYLGTGKTYDRIIVSKPADAMADEMTTAVVLKEIQEGQKKALTQICLEKYSRSFDSLDEKKKDKLKKQFPVLFQELAGENNNIR